MKMIKYLSVIILSLVVLTFLACREEHKTESSTLSEASNVTVKTTVINGVSGTDSTNTTFKTTNGTLPVVGTKTSVTTTIAITTKTTVSTSSVSNVSDKMPTKKVFIITGDKDFSPVG